MEAPVTRAALIAALACALALAAAPAGANERALSPEAQEHLDRGIAAYRDGRFDAAAVELQAAYAIEPRREVLFAWAQAERQRGRCDVAATLYRSFLALAPPEAEAAKARAHLSACDAELASAAAPDDAAHSTAPASPPPSRGLDRFALVLVGAGALAGGAGGFFLYRAYDENRAGDYAAFDRHAAASERRYWLGVGGLGIGGALTAAGLWRLAAGGEAEPVQLSFDLAPGGAGIGVAGQF